MSDTHQLFINGEFVPAESGETFVSTNPYDQSEVGKYAKAGPADINKAVAAAREAFDNGPWSSMPAEERAGYVKALADQIAERTKEIMALEIADAGATLKKAQGDLFLSGAHMKYFSKLATTYPFRESLDDLSKEGANHNYVLREPVGVCGQIIPWNFPLMMAVWKLGPALAAGCTVVLKPAEETPASAIALAQIIKDIGLPKGVVNIVTGFGKEAGEPLVLHPDVDKVAFTGSTEIGKHIMAQAATSMKRVTLECGGKSANIILDDADLDIAIDGSLFGIFYHSGQCCTAGSRLLVPESKKGEILEQMVEKTKKIALGDPTQKSTDMGPVVSQKQLDRILSLIEKGKSEGATCLTGGQRASGEGLDKGFFIEPTIFDGVTNDMTIAQEEIFGPVLSVITYKSDEEAIKLANQSSFGLAAGVWSRDNNRAEAVAKKLRAGTVWINEYHLTHVKAPFGGYKQSGLGRELGPWALDAYTELKHVHVDELGSREKKFWYDSVVKPDSLVHN